MALSLTAVRATTSRTWSLALATAIEPRLELARH
jgi:hypothetical protein